MRPYTFLILLLAASCGSDQPAQKKDETSSVTDVSADQPPVTEENKEEQPETTAPSNVPSKISVNETTAASKTTTKSNAPAQNTEITVNAPASRTDKGFTDIAKLDPSIQLDIRYATTDNFTKSKIYDCPLCLLRPVAAEAIVKAHKALKKRGLGLKMFDCYRPRPYQQRLWDKIPNPDYVTPPAKGSMHSRGAAVDLTIVDARGKELDMGTPYDFFGREAHTDNNTLPQKVLANRRILREAMEAVGFKGIRTEWWHFSYQSKEWPLSDYVWPCDNAK